jgi:glycosyltransferase involved in cell wall biosynthesis
MKIAFITSGDPRDKRIYSGVAYFMAKALQKYCGEVSFLGPVYPLEWVLGAVYSRALRLIKFKTHFAHRHSLLVSKRYGEIFTRKLSRKDFDLVFSAKGFAEVAFVETKLPLIYSSDSTFALLNNYYIGYFSNLTKRSVEEAHLLQGLAIQRASLLVYHSAWAAESAFKHYHADKARIHIIPPGANLENPPPREMILKKRKSDRCRLLFVGENWERKGGSIASEALLKLEELGIQAELTICGCIPPRGFSHKRITVIPFLDKNNEKQAKELSNLYLTSDFFLLPTRQEAFGLVFAEASAFGLPCITTRTGGVPEAVRDGENGFLLPPSARGEDYAKVIARLYQDDDLYYRLVKSSRQAFDERLNWDAWGRQVKKLISELLGAGETVKGAK